MNKNLTDVTLVLDRSGSMNSILADAQGGLDKFILDQKNAPGDCTFTLVQFDTLYEVPIRAKPIKDVTGHTIVPRGGTALLDAVGRAIIETGDRLRAMSETDRPGLVVFVILTDGEENSSCEFIVRSDDPTVNRAGKIKEMIEHQQDVYKWQFSFLGKDQDAWTVAGGLGIKGASCQYSADSVPAAFAAGSANVLRMRVATARGDTVNNAYSDAEIAAMTATTKRDEP